MGRKSGGNDQYKSESQIKAVVLGFETCTTGKEAFTHREHLTVAAWYLSCGSQSEALVKMRQGLHRFLNHHQVDPGKYNETITVFWIRVVRDYIRGLDSTLSLVQVINAVVESFQNSRLMFDYYSEALLQSVAAKSNWVEPDLKSFES